MDLWIGLQRTFGRNIWFFKEIVGCVRKVYIYNYIVILYIVFGIMVYSQIRNIIFILYIEIYVQRDKMFFQRLYIFIVDLGVEFKFKVLVGDYIF